MVELGFQVIEFDFTDTYYSTGKLEDALQLDYMGVPLGGSSAASLDILARACLAMWKL